jgi:parvulin-like peptidyl-prolyl isomerase
MHLANWRISVAAALGAVVAIGGIGAGLAQSPSGKPQPAARVNGEEISVAEVQAVLEQRPSPVPVSLELQKEMRKAAVEMLVDDLLIRQFLRRNAPAPEQNAIQKEYDQLYEALKKQNKTLEQFLHEGKMTKENLRDDIVARLQWKGYLTARFPEAEIKAYYDANKLFFDNVVVRASHILVKVPGAASADDKQKGRAKLETIRQEIVAGKITFEEAARKYSDCPSKEKGGDIGPFPYKFVVVEPFARAAFAAKKGDLTDVVATEFGFHLIKVTDRTPGEPTQFEQIRDVVRDVMAQEQELYQRVLAEQKKSAKVEVLFQ